MCVYVLQSSVLRLDYNWISVSLVFYFRIGLIEKITFEQTFEGIKGVSQTAIWGKYGRQREQPAKNSFFDSNSLQYTRHGIGSRSLEE